MHQAAATVESTPPLRAQIARAPSALRPDALDCFGDESRAVPILLRAADPENEISQHLRAAIGVIHFGMKFHAVVSFGGILNRGHGIVGPRGNVKAFGQARYVIAVAIPDFQLCGESRKQLGIPADFNCAGPYSRRSARSTFPPSVRVSHCMP